MRPLLTWLLILGYGLVALGLPLPLGIERPDASPSPAGTKLLAAKDRSQPFPCMDSPCGCATAEQCFRDCCCTTFAERLAFARRHRLGGIVLAALEARVAAAAPSQPAGETEEAPKLADSCCAVKPSGPPSGPACSAGSSGEGAGAPEEALRQKRPTVILRAMLACQGIVAQWLAVGVSLPPPRVEFFALLWSRERLVVLDEKAESPPPDPVAHPPWAA